MALFPARPKKSEAPKNAAELFKGLQRDRPIKFLWAHQSKVLETYEAEYLTSENIATELPTGSGKSLLGLLLGELRRQQEGKRCIYLCPTRQLFNQVQRQALLYGVPAATLHGKQSEELSAFAKYERANALAISTYSAIFNTNPRLKRCQCVDLR